MYVIGCRNIPETLALHVLVQSLVTVGANAGLAANASARAIRESLCGVPDVHCHQPYEGALTHLLIQEDAVDCSPSSWLEPRASAHLDSYVLMSPENTFSCQLCDSQGQNITLQKTLQTNHSSSLEPK